MKLRKVRKEKVPERAALLPLEDEISLRDEEKGNLVPKKKQANKTLIRQI